MFDLTDADIKELAKIYKKAVVCGDKNASVGPYTIEYVLECGLKYIYGEQHLSDGHVVDCQSLFKADLESCKEHRCKMDFISMEENVLDIGGRIEHFEWSKNNMACVTNNNMMYGFFKKQKLFSIPAKDVTALAATSSQILFGTDSGKLEMMSMPDKRIETHNAHNNFVKKIKVFDEKIVSSGGDGSLWCKSQLKLTQSAISDFVLHNNSIYCACEDNSVIKVKLLENTGFVKSGAVYDNFDDVDNLQISTMMGHQDKITTITGECVVATSSLDGNLGIVKNKISLYPVEATKHVAKSEPELTLFGMESIKRFDLNRCEALELHKSQNAVYALSERKDLIAFATTGKDNLLWLMDTRTKDVTSKKLNFYIRDIEFGKSYENLLVVTDGEQIMCDIRRI